MVQLELAQAIAMVGLVRRGTELVAALDRGAGADELLALVVAIADAAQLSETTLLGLPAQRVAL